MSYQIPVYQLQTNDNDEIYFLAHLNELTSEANVNELNEVFNYMDESLNEIFQQNNTSYARENLRLFFFERLRNVYKLWYPQGKEAFLNKDFDKSKLEKVAVINFDKIKENFPHIFWTEEQLNN